MGGEKDKGLLEEALDDAKDHVEEFGDWVMDQLDTTPSKDEKDKD